MNLTFPKHFAFGTSTSAYQIETPFEHDWVNLRSRDGHIFDQTTGHERMVEEDVENIHYLAPHYRMGLMWSRLQRKPMGEFDTSACAHYHDLLGRLRAKGVKVMMVLHHFANPIWFAKAGGWESPSSIHMFVDFAGKVVDKFGDYITSWNTFNEPNLYAGMGWVAGEFPSTSSATGFIRVGSMVIQSPVEWPGRRLVRRCRHTQRLPGFPTRARSQYH